MSADFLHFVVGSTAPRFLLFIVGIFLNYSSSRPSPIHAVVPCRACAVLHADTPSTQQTPTQTTTKSQARTTSRTTPWASTKVMPPSSCGTLWSELDVASPGASRGRHGRTSSASMTQRKYRAYLSRYWFVRSISRGILVLFA